MNNFQIQLIWNREFNWVHYNKPYSTLEEAKKLAMSMINSGDGARVKKVRVVDSETDKILWSYG